MCFIQSSVVLLQVVCIIIAALLQYFFIAMFCWALCEGLQLFMTLSTGKNKKSTRLKYFFIIGWSKSKTSFSRSLGVTVSDSSRWWQLAGSSPRGGDSYMKRIGMFIVSLRGIDERFWSQLWCPGLNDSCFSCQSTIKTCLAQEHNTMSLARAPTRTARSGVERTNHEATVPPTILAWFKLYLTPKRYHFKGIGSITCCCPWKKHWTKKPGGNWTKIQK